MKQSRLRRLGSNLIAIGFGVPLMLMMWAERNGMATGLRDSAGMDRALFWTEWLSPLVAIGAVLWMCGGRKREKP